MRRLLRRWIGPAGAVERHPGHHFGMDEMLRRAPDFPDAFVGLAPDFFQMLRKSLADLAAAWRGRQAALARLGHHIGQFAINIELQLLRRAIADAHRTRILVAGQMRQLDFVQPLVAHHAVHGLKLLGRAGDHPHQPMLPDIGFLGIAGIEKGQQRESGVPQPAIAIIPVAGAADLFRQRGGDRGDDAAGGLVAEAFQGEQRAHDRLRHLPLTLHMPVHPPSIFRSAPARYRRRSLRHRLEGLAIAHHKGHARSPFFTVKRATRMHVLAAQLAGVRKVSRCGTGDGGNGLVVDPVHPGNGDAIIEADHQFGVHLDMAGHAFDDAHDGAVARARGMKSISRALPVAVVKFGFQNQAVAAIARGVDFDFFALRRDQPAAMLGSPSSAAKQASESKRGMHNQSIEPSRPTSAALWQSPITA